MSPKVRKCSRLCTYGEHVENFKFFNVLTVSAQTGALAHFWRQILHLRAHRKCTDWSTCALLATNPAFSSSPSVHRLEHWPWIREAAVPCVCSPSLTSRCSAFIAGASQLALPARIPQRRALARLPAFELVDICFRLGPPRPYFRSVIQRRCRDGLFALFGIRGPSMVGVSHLTLGRKML